MSVLIPDAIARPTSNTPAVREKALKAFLPRVLEWLGEDPPCETEQIASQLSEVLNGWNDGFKAAKELEDRYYWEANSELVEILDGFSGYTATQDAVKAWVKEVNPQSAFKLGDRVIWKRRTGNVEGRITKIYAETAQYIVSKDGEAKGCGTYVNWEDATQLQNVIGERDGKIEVGE